jgi:hypothetical protein
MIGIFRKLKEYKMKRWRLLNKKRNVIIKEAFKYGDQVNYSAFNAMILRILVNKK